MEATSLFGLIEDERILLKRERDFTVEDREGIEQAIEKTIVEYIEEILLERNITIKEIERIGIAAPGTHKNGIIVKAENLGIFDYNILETLRKHFYDVEITLNNDAKCAAMCEKEYGNLKDCDDGIFICLGTGIGGAVFLGGKLLKAKKYVGFELRTYDV